MSNIQSSDGSASQKTLTRDGMSTSGWRSIHTETSDENENMEEVLTSFRDMWHKEIASDVAGKSQPSPLQEAKEENCDIEVKARLLFMQGIENEQKGRVYEAIQFYRKAVQLVPDIEFKLYDATRNVKNKTSDVLDNTGDKDTGEILSAEEDSEDGPIDLSLRLQNWMARAPSLCVPAQEQQATHISSLPLEIMIIILRWVVSDDLDIRSLEMCSMVCRGFYLCCRDSEIWRLICLRLWGVSGVELGNFLSWRDMYLKRPHLNFTGCYISKTTYVRHGENSFQDQFYRPWHVVEYYRYLRFFPEGSVLMMTTAEGPVPMLGHLRYRNTRYPAVIRGRYYVREDRVDVVVTREFCERSIINGRSRGRHNRCTEHREQAYHLQLQLKPWKKRINNQLVWLKYTVYTRCGATNTATNFDVHGTKFSPFWFSRVKSYSCESDKPLI